MPEREEAVTEKAEEKSEVQEVPRPVTVAEYRKKVGQEFDVTTPSGMLFRVRQLSPMDYIKEGLADIPNEFFQFVAELQVGIEPERDSEQVVKNLEMFEKFLSITLNKGIISPPVTMIYSKEKEETHLLWTELTQEDQAFLSGVIVGRLDARGKIRAEAIS